MKIEIESVGDITIFRIKGKILTGRGDKILKETVKDLVASGGSKLILDLKKVPYVDNCGLQEIVRAHIRIMREEGAEDSGLKLLNLNSRLRDLLLTNKLLGVFSIFDDEKKAIASFEKKES